MHHDEEIEERRFHLCSRSKICVEGELFICLSILFDEICLYVKLYNGGQWARKASQAFTDEAFVWNEKHTRAHGGWKPHCRQILHAIDPVSAPPLVNLLSFLCSIFIVRQMTATFPNQKRSELKKSQILDVFLKKKKSDILSDEKWQNKARVR